MATNTFHCSVITPERAVLEADATFVAFPAHDGEVGILKNHAPLLYKLGVGVLRVKTAEGEQAFFVDGGFAQMVENRLTLLTEQARPVAEVDRAAAERAREEVRALPAAGGEAEMATRQRAEQRARVLERIANANR
ncbi:MAG TPA: ATP synthase F1 subunit epsilon [Thermoanaerobaculia bacterium]|nr:ATP synthase F1 subunit epsilon [Thermoanaerobaculia bacterium]